MITADHVAAIGSLMGTDPGSKKDPQTAQLQALVNLTEAIKAVALVLIDIRDGRKS